FFSQSKRQFKARLCAMKQRIGSASGLASSVYLRLMAVPPRRRERYLGASRPRLWRRSRLTRRIDDRRSRRWSLTGIPNQQGAARRYAATYASRLAAQTRRPCAGNGLRTATQLDV